MPIRRELLPLYPRNWADLAAEVKRDGRCQGCGRPHLTTIRCLPDGRWWDEVARIWRDGRGRLLNLWPNLLEATEIRLTRVVIAACHVDGDPANNRRRNLRAWCQRCHLLHDLPLHIAQRWLTYRRRWAMGDLFLGPYDVRILRRERRGVVAAPQPRRVVARGLPLTREAKPRQLL